MKKISLRGIAMLGTIIAALITGMFGVINTLISICGTNQVSSNQLGMKANNVNQLQRCDIKIKSFKLNYKINENSYHAYENDDIRASNGDRLMLENFEMILDIEPPECESYIGAEAYIRKTEAKNIDPQDKFDYSDGRFTKATRAREFFTSSLFLKENREKEWLLKPGRNRIVIAILQYDSQNPEGVVIKRVFFNIRN